MKNNILPVVLSLALTSLPTFGATKIGGSIKILSPQTNKEISTARIGKPIKVKISTTDLNLIANKNVTFTYVLSVLPKGSNTPVSFSGKFTGKFTLPASEGGATKTKKEMADLAGVQTVSELITIPEFMPVGKATLTLSLAGDGVGSINFSKILEIQL